MILGCSLEYLQLGNKTERHASILKMCLMLTSDLEQKTRWNEKPLYVQARAYSWARRDGPKTTDKKKEQWINYLEVSEIQAKKNIWS